MAPRVRGGDIGLVWLSLAVGLPSIAIGTGLIIGGRSISRRRGPTKPPSEVF